MNPSNADIRDALKALVLAMGHDPRCPATPCTCGKAAQLRLAHGEACRLLRALGELK